MIGLLLAGGRSRRMGGGDKCLLPLAGRPILDRVLARFAPQTDRVILNVNGDPGRFAAHGLTLVPDNVAGFAGPLAGILAGLDWAAEHAPGTPLVATAPADAPFLPRDLVARLAAALPDGRMAVACAASTGRMHPVCGLWPVALREELRIALTTEGLRRVGDFATRHHAVIVTFPPGPPDPFFNINTPADLAEGERLLSLHGEPP